MTHQRTYKRSLLLCSLVFLCLGTTNAASNLTRISAQFSKNYTIYERANDEISLILLYPRNMQGLQLEYTKSGTSAAYLGTLGEKCVAINGGYFGYEKVGDLTYFQPAGPISIYTSIKGMPQIIPSATRPEDDVNLHVAIYYSSHNVVSIGKPRLIGQGSSFFAGPLLVDQGVINNALEQNISHRNSKHYRSFLIQKSNRQAIRGITTNKVTLTTLASYLQEIMGDEIFTAVNLDGGSSSSFYSPRLSYNSNKKLPILYRMCE